MGPQQARSTGLRQAEEALLVAFRRPTRLPLDAGLAAVQATIPPRTRSARPRRLKRHGLNRLPDGDGDKPAQKRGQEYPLGAFDIDSAAVRPAEGQLCRCVASERASQCAEAEGPTGAHQTIAAPCLRHLLAAVP